MRDYRNAVGFRAEFKSFRPLFRRVPSKIRRLRPSVFACRRRALFAVRLRAGPALGARGGGKNVFIATRPLKRPPKTTRRARRGRGGRRRGEKRRIRQTVRYGRKIYISLLPPHPIDCIKYKFDRVLSGAPPCRCDVAESDARRAAAVDSVGVPESGDGGRGGSVCSAAVYVTFRAKRLTAFYRPPGPIKTEISRTSE